MQESEEAAGNSSKRIFNEAAEFLNEKVKVEDNFITRMRERCWESLPSLNIPRR
jgi:hypothetical protein